jgi:GxxExxY protein
MNQLERREPEDKLDKLAHAVIGAAIEVHRHLGPGYLESVYQAALEVELKLQGIPFEPQKPVGVSYKGHPVGDGRLDFLVSDMLVVELKAVDELADVHKAQVISYLKATRLHLGLLINFNVTVLKNGVKRVIRSPQGGD